MNYSPSVFTVNNSYKRIVLIGKVISAMPDVYAKYISFCSKKDSAGITEAARELIFDLILKFFSYLPAKNLVRTHV
jgi:hypothetical protein